MSSRFHRAMRHTPQTVERLRELEAVYQARCEMFDQFPSIKSAEDAEAALAFYNRRAAELLADPLDESLLPVEIQP